MNIFSFIINNIQTSIKKLDQNSTLKPSIKFSNNLKTQGQVNSAIAMQLSSQLKTNTQNIATIIINNLLKDAHVKDIDLATPGFINITLHKAFWISHFRKILYNNQDYLTPDIGKKKSINIEYVSANPTGPLHIGNARAAIYGASLTRLLVRCGFNVTSEFYVNDFGKQTDRLAESILSRYDNIVLKTDKALEKHLYQGNYIASIAQELFYQYKDSLRKQPDYYAMVKQYAIDKMLDTIKNTLHKIDVIHDVFFYENTLHKNGEIEKVISELKAKKLIYQDYLDTPKGKNNKTHILKSKHLLFKTTLFKDCQDRPITKEDGTYSYFGAEIAYVKNKISRNFDVYITILGADHIGYVTRLNAAFEALKSPGAKQSCIIKVTQLVKYLQDGQIIKMSKRSGNFETIDTVLNHVPADVIKYFMVSKKVDTNIDFDLAKTVEQSKSNPIFYIQYAYARCNSLINKAQQVHNNIKPTFDTTTNVNLDLISTDQEIALVIKLIEWHTIVQDCIEKYDTCRITSYLYSVACNLHNLWESTTHDKPYKFITEDFDTTYARISIAYATINVMQVGLDILGIKPKKTM